MCTKFYTGESFRVSIEKLTIVVGELELTKFPEKLLEGLFLASQVTRKQDNDEVYGEFTLYYRVLVLVYFLGFVGGVLTKVLVCLVVNFSFGGRYAESPVNCVEVGTQEDLLAYDDTQLDEELVHDLNSQLLQPDLVTLTSLFMCIMRM